MKLAGIDGVVIDWYGTSTLHDYETIHRNTAHLIEYVKKRDCSLPYAMKTER